MPDHHRDPYTARIAVLFLFNNIILSNYKEMHMSDLLEQLLEQERELQFASFNEATAWQIGSQLVERAQREGLPIVIDIMRGTHQLFHASLSGTSPDNDEWVKRKARAVYRFGHCSLYMGELLKSRNQTIEKDYLIPESKIAPHGGSFPIIIKDTGIVGTITVSGLPPQDDHKTVVEAIRNYLASQK
jgi:uncharacterized protein (UPF0303 family)